MGFFGGGLSSTQTRENAGDFCLKRKMPAVSPRPTAGIQLLVFARHPLRRAGAGKAVFGFDSPLQFAVERFNKVGGRLWRRRRCLWAWCLSAYRRDSAFVGLNAQWLVSRPALCYQVSAAIVASLANSTCQAAAVLAFPPPTSRSGADMITRESDLTMLAVCCLSDRRVIKLTCG